MTMAVSHMPAQSTIRMNYQFEITKPVWHMEY